MTAHQHVVFSFGMKPTSQAGPPAAVQPSSVALVEVPESEARHWQMPEPQKRKKRRKKKRKKRGKKRGHGNGSPQHGQKCANQHPAGQQKRTAPGASRAVWNAARGGVLAVIAVKVAVQSPIVTLPWHFSQIPVNGAGEQYFFSFWTGVSTVAHSAESAAKSPGGGNTG